jgi:hypothetical protein
VYLDDMITRGKLNIDPSKIKAILKWSTPTNVCNEHNTYRNIYN